MGHSSEISLELSSSLAYAGSAACAREPIHIPGSIQAHGVLLAVREDDGVVTHASENSGMVFAPPVSPGVSLSAVFPGAELERFRTELAAAEVRQLPRRVMGVTGARGDAFELLAHRHAGRLILEFEPAREAVGTIEACDTLFAESAALEHAPTPEALGEAAVEAVRRISGFDKVMLYRFDEDWNGSVLAEVGPRGMEAYVGQRFPASDIPAQARELYRVNPVRLIPAVEHAPARVLGEPGDEKPLDLSHSVLRGVAPVHIEYLQNMNVAASMSISVLRERKLWGLIACHHRAARFVPQAVRLACSVLGQLVSHTLASIELKRDADHAARMRKVQLRVVRCVAIRRPFDEALAECGEDVLALLDADGAAVWHQGRRRLIGATPTEREVSELVDWIVARNVPVAATNWLAGEYPKVRDFGERPGGLLATTLSAAEKSVVVWFRREQVETINWAGDPRKPFDVEADRLHPRRSFAVWQERVGERCRRWTHAELDAAAALRESLVELEAGRPRDQRC